MTTHQVLLCRSLDCDVSCRVLARDDVSRGRIIRVLLLLLLLGRVVIVIIIVTGR